jgi:hypothetical protein
VRAAWRMLLDNAGLSVGPQVVIDKARIEPENGSWKLEPRKVWLKTGDDLNDRRQAVRGVQHPVEHRRARQGHRARLKFIDETTSLPLIAQGEQGAHITQTAGGMSMLMNSANVIFRNVVKNWDDDMTTPMIRRFYDWNMQFNPKEEIKGDMQVEARGTSALLVRELQSANLMMITERWSSHPVLSLALKVYDTMRMTVQSLSINPDDVLGTRDEFEAKLKAQAGERAAGSAHRRRADRRPEPQGAERRQREIARSPARRSPTSRRGPARPARRSRRPQKHADKIAATSA